ncbi:MAG: hypothetical protein ACP5DX_16500 [Paracoccaceae bacterium]
MKTVIYIGHHKTGSTSLQQFLAQNSLRLLQSGILYPAVDGRGLSYQLLKAIGGGDHALDLPVVIREPHNALAQKMLAEAAQKWRLPAYYRHLPRSGHLIRMIRSQIDILEPNAVLLVSEVFSNFSQFAPDQIERLRDALEDSDETQIYICLRRPDEYLVSWQNQRLKFGNRLKPLRADGLAGYFSSIHFDYAWCLKGWAEYFSRAELTVRRYSDVRANGGSVEDFMVQSVLDFPDGLIPAKTLNRSIPYAMMEISRLCNDALPPAQARSFRNSLLTLVDDLEDVPPNKDVEMYGAENRAALLERFVPIHEELSRITGEDPFFPDLEDIAAPRPIPELEAVGRILAQLDKPLLRRHFARAGVEFLMELKRRDALD